jgi:nitrate reductase NapE component
MRRNLVINANDTAAPSRLQTVDSNLLRILTAAPLAGAAATLALDGFVLWLLLLIYAPPGLTPTCPSYSAGSPIWGSRLCRFLHWRSCGGSHAQCG